MNILFLTSWYPSHIKPGAGVFVKDWARAASLLNEVVILTWTGIDPSARDTIELSDAVEDGIRTLRARYRPSRLRGVAQLRLLRSLATGVRQLIAEGWRPDVIHAHVYSSGFYAVLIGAWFKIPVVITEHFSGFARGIVTGIERWKALYAFNNSAFVLPVSENQREVLLSFGVRVPMLVVPNPVDVSLFSPPEKVPPSNKRKDREKKLLFVGLLSSIKGIDLLLSALSQVRNIGTDWHLAIIGDGPERKTCRLNHAILALMASSHFMALSHERTLCTS